MTDSPHVAVAGAEVAVTTRSGLLMVRANEAVLLASLVSPWSL